MELTNVPSFRKYLGRFSEIVLVPLRYEDLPTYYGWYTKESVYRYNGGQDISARISLRAFLDEDFDRSQKRRPGFHFYALRMEDQTLAGAMSFTSYRGDVHCDWGVSTLGCDALRGTGLATIAKGVLLRHIFSRGVRTVATHVLPENLASLRLNQKLGARIVRPASRYVRLTRLLITRDAFQKSRLSHL